MAPSNASQGSSVVVAPSSGASQPRGTRRLQVGNFRAQSDLDQLYGATKGGLVAHILVLQAHIKRCHSCRQGKPVELNATNSVDNPIAKEWDQRKLDEAVKKARETMKKKIPLLMKVRLPKFTIEERV